MSFKPTPEQARIFKFIQKRKENILIEAYAGAGKTTTIVEAVKLLPKDSSIMFLAFNKHIQEELKTRLPEHVRCYTTHGLGMAALKRKYGDKITFDEFKADKWLHKKSKYWKLEDDFHSVEKKLRYLQDMKKMVNLCRLSLTIDKKYIPYIADRYEVKLKVDRDVPRLMKVLDSMTSDRKTFDFTDMVYLPAIDNSIWLFPQDYVVIDECQDINRAQQRLIEKMLKKDKISKKYTGRLIAIGDGFQCQPEGTEITMHDGSIKKIEELSVGDIVVSYNRSEKGQFTGHYVDYLKRNSYISDHLKSKAPTIEAIEKRKINENIIVVESGEKVSKYTKNHKCMVSLRKDRLKYHVLYLMERDGLFRIGIAPLWSSNGNDFSSFRAKQEKANKFWVLNVYEDKFKAYLDEQFYSTINSIPQLRFYDRQNSGNYNQDVIDKFYFRFDKKKMFDNVNKLLKFFGKLYEFPFWFKGQGTHFSKNHMFELHACNIIPEIMNMIHFDTTNKGIRTHGGKKRHEIIRPTYIPINDLYFEEYSGYVYSLKVSKYEMYVADGMLTHNSIYGFTGITDRTFLWFKEFKNTKILPLSYSFRCAKNIVKHANRIVPAIKALPNAPDGVVRDGSAVKEARDGDFVLCRTTMPLIKMFFEFLALQKKAVIKGSDIGLQLIQYTTDFKTISSLTTHWCAEVTSFKNEIVRSGVLNPNEHSGFVALEDKVNTLLFLANISPTIPDLKNNIETIFTDKLTGIVLSTVHKAKGLEADRVFIIRPDLIPYPNTKKWQIAQEKNLEYVAITRAKTELIYDHEWTDEEE